MSFALEGSLLEAKDILAGGPGKDGIPALVRPRVVAASVAEYLRDTDRVLGVTIGGVARAYPIPILNWHELVNDEVGGTPVLVSYCPLCGSGVAFDRRVDGRTLEFGVSGLLHQSNVLMYDRTDQGLWSQLRMEAVSGPRAGTRLRALPLTLASWGAWRSLHPDGTVLARPTGYGRDYARDPYLGYADHPGLMFPVLHRDQRRDAKEWVVGVLHGTTARAYPFRELARAQRPVEEDVGEVRVRVHFDPMTQTARVTSATGEALPATYAFWFAWAAFHPETTLFEAAAGDQQSPVSLGDLLPLAEGNWWAYEERSRGGAVAAVERRQVRSWDGAGWLVRTRQQRYDHGQADALLTVDERVVVRSDGIVRGFAGAEREAAYLIQAPVESGRRWAGSGGDCRISAVDRTVPAAGTRFRACVDVTCEQGGGLVRIVSSYAPGVGLVREDVWFGGIAAIPITSGLGDEAGRRGEGASPSTSLVLTAWGRRHS